MTTRYKVSLDGKEIGFVNLGQKKKVFRDDGTEIRGDKHTCGIHTNPNKGDKLHLKHFGKENHVDLKGHGQFEPGTRRFFHDEPRTADEALKPLGQDDWEATDAGGPIIP